ncbi:MAG: tryptophan synthase subunit alpha [Bacteroidia bacterium]|nr:tryptophan synthase subunit alpha [Bacteroidia bacterium]
MKKEIQIPVFLMGYLNPVLQYGFENFLKKAKENGFAGTIIPDLPLHEYEQEFQSLYQKYDLKNIFLITPQTPEERIRKIDNLSNGFIYLVSHSGTTGTKGKFTGNQINYFNRIKNLNLNNPLLIGFGISNKETYGQASNYANGAIIGSSFIKALQNENYLQHINPFINNIKA